MGLSSRLFVRLTCGVIVLLSFSFLLSLPQHHTHNTRNRPSFCTETVHVDVDVSKAWDDDGEKRRLCEQITNAGGGSIEDLAIFALSSGNLMLASALESEFCSIGEDADVVWTAVEVRCVNVPPSLVSTCLRVLCACAWFAFSACAPCHVCHAMCVGGFVLSLPCFSRCGACSLWMAAQGMLNHVTDPHECVLFCVSCVCVCVFVCLWIVVWIVGMTLALIPHRNRCALCCAGWCVAAGLVRLLCLSHFRYCKNPLSFVATLPNSVPQAVSISLSKAARAVTSSAACTYDADSKSWVPSAALLALVRASEGNGWFGACTESPPQRSVCL